MSFWVTSSPKGISANSLQCSLWLCASISLPFSVRFQLQVCLAFNFLYLVLGVNTILGPALSGSGSEPLLFIQWPFCTSVNVLFAIALPLLIFLIYLLLESWEIQRTLTTDSPSCVIRHFELLPSPVSSVRVKLPVQILYKASIPWTGLDSGKSLAYFLHPQPFVTKFYRSSDLSSLFLTC